MPFAYAPLSSPQPRESYCYRCGNLLGNSRGVLYLAYRRRSSLDAFLSMLTWPLVWLKNFYDFRFGMDDHKCRRCGVDAEREWRVDVLGCQPDIPLKRPSLRPIRHTVDVTESGLPEELTGVPVPVYGLTDQPLGLVMRRVSWDVGRLRPSIEGVGLLYDTGPGRSPRPRLLLEQAAGSGAANRLRSPVQELRAIVEVVQEHGARGQREHYSDQGNVFRHWHLERLPDASRRSVELSIGGVTVRVDVAQWSDPQQVVLAHLSLDGIAVMATAVDVPPARLLAMLKGLAPLGRASGSLTGRV